MSLDPTALLSTMVGGLMSMFTKPKEPDIPTPPTQVGTPARPRTQGDTSAGGTLLTGASGVKGAATTAKKTAFGQ